MTAYTHKIGDGTQISANGPALRVHRIHFDAAKEALHQSIASFGSADTLTIFEVPKGTFVFGVYTDVTTAEGATLTVDIGDGDDADGYQDGVNFNSVAQARGVNALAEAAPNTFVGYTNGKFYGADGAIIMTFNNAGVDTCVVDLAIVYAPIFAPA